MSTLDVLDYRPSRSVVIDDTARPGVVMAGDEGSLYWIVHNQEGAFAIQLLRSGLAPQFAVFGLNKTSLGHGIWLGPTKLQLDLQTRGASRNKAGIFILRQ